MIIDIFFAIAVLLAILKGYRQGLVVAVFSVIALIVGLAAAIKLSAVVASYIGKAVNITDKWLPIVSFILVFVLVVLIIRWCAVLLRKAIEFSMMGWIDKLAGILLFTLLYLLIFSVVLFYCEQISLLKPETKTSSVTYEFIQPWGPKVMDAFGKILPLFKNMFTELKDFFGTMATQVPTITPQ